MKKLLYFFINSITIVLATGLFAASTSQQVTMELTIPERTATNTAVDPTQGVTSEIKAAGTGVTSVDSTGSDSDSGDLSEDYALTFSHPSSAKSLPTLKRSIDLERFKTSDLLLDTDIAFIALSPDEMQTVRILPAPNANNNKGSRFFLYQTNNSKRTTPIPFDIYLADTVNKDHSKLIRQSSDLSKYLTSSSSSLSRKKLYVVIKRSLFPAVEKRVGTYQGNILISIESID